MPAQAPDWLRGELSQVPDLEAAGNRLFNEYLTGPEIYVLLQNRQCDRKQAREVQTAVVPDHVPSWSSLGQAFQRVFAPREVSGMKSEC